MTTKTPERDTEDPEREFRAPRTMTPAELGDNLARLVWESFSDFIADGDAEIALREMGLVEDGVPDPHAVEEALIFLMWAHTRGVQLAFLGRAPEERMRSGLDALHRAVFEDMVEHGTPQSQLPFFEQRVGARYAEYNPAADASDERLGEVVVAHLTAERDGKHPAFSRAVADRAIAVAGPLRDFLEEVELVD